VGGKLGGGAGESEAGEEDVVGGLEAGGGGCEDVFWGEGGEGGEEGEEGGDEEDVEGGVDGWGDGLFG